MFKVINSSVVSMAFALLLPVVTQAAGSPTKVAPLGFALGEASRSVVTSTLRGQVELEPQGTNRYSAGPMLLAEGAGLGITGLEKVLFIFDRTDTLVAVEMTLDKEFDRGFDKAYGRLAAKYPVVKQTVPFVGNKYARFESAGNVIELDAPHLSFTMAVVYMTRDFEQAFKTIRRKDAETKEKNESGKF